MSLPLLLILTLFLLSPPNRLSQQDCIEPRNHYSEDSIVDIEWSPNDDFLYISSIGRVSIYEVEGEHSLIAVHEGCDGRFPEIDVTDFYYAIGSDFLSTLAIYESDTNTLRFTVNFEAENIRSIALKGFDDYGVVATSSYDEDGFFDIERNIEVMNYRKGEVVAQLITDANASDINLPFDVRVGFASDDAVLITGIDTENAFVSFQPIVLLWDWHTNELTSVDIQTNSLIEPIGTRRLAVLNKLSEQQISLELMTLLPELQTDISLVYEIPIDDLSSVRLSGNSERSLLAIENEAGNLWIVDLAKEEIIAFRELKKFANVISFDHMGQYLALAFPDGAIELWDFQSNELTEIARLFP